MHNGGGSEGGRANASEIDVCVSLVRRLSSRPFLHILILMTLLRCERLRTILAFVIKVP